MVVALKIVDDPAAYGSKGQAWHPDFVAYMKDMVTHPVYAGMPDAVKADGKIQWEAPSNRQSGQYQNTHHERREWWRKKAQEIGIDLAVPTWISKTAKRIHPTEEKPCKRCGHVMKISYAYPNGTFQRRLNALFKGSIQFDTLETIMELVERIVDEKGAENLKLLPKLLSTRALEVPNLGPNIEDWVLWVEDKYIPSEPSVLSPGVMSNAPDRFDGFHSFNLCCRKKADAGRRDSNMRSYLTDRRVFEYWSDGNWIAADRLMGLVRSLFRDTPCADGGEGPCSPDHIGPLSLGFAHRPEFRLLSQSANSAKNNRMTFWDVEHLRQVEENGGRVISWYALPLWNRRKSSVVNEETAQRLSKLLRDNQRNAMHLLCRLLGQRHFAFLATLLELEYADRNIEFVGLRVENFLTAYETIRSTVRHTRYAAQQKSRRIRIAFEAIRDYANRENRHGRPIEDVQIEAAMSEALKILEGVKPDIRELNSELSGLLLRADQRAPEDELRNVSVRIPPPNRDEFMAARAALSKCMDVVGDHLSGLWDSDRYVRAPFDFEIY